MRPMSRTGRYRQTGRTVATTSLQCGNPSRREGLDNIDAAWSAHHAAAERRYRVTPGSLTSWFVHRRNINTTTAPVSTSETAHRPNALASNRRFPIRRR